MSLHTVEFELASNGSKTIHRPWFHSGVTGSGDMEVLVSKQDFGGRVQVKVVTPVIGFDEVWKKVLAKAVAEIGIRDVRLEINDDNATPIVVFMRLKQAFAEEFEEGED